MELSRPLIEQICAGHEIAWEEFVRTSWRYAVQTCWLILRNVHDAEESAQESFLKLYQSRANIKDTEKFSYWFHRILVNTALDKVRKRKPLANLEDADVLYDGDTAGDAELRLAIRDAINQLSNDERAALVLHHFNGLPETEAAAALGWGLGKYKYRLGRARKQLSKLLVDYGPISQKPVEFLS